MEIAKTFDRNGVRYRPGDPLPEGLDQITLDHYKRYGMVREAKPAEAKPAAPRQRKPAEPKQTKPAGPDHTAAGEQLGLNPGQQPAEVEQSTDQGDAQESPAADALEAQDAVKD